GYVRGAFTGADKDRKGLFREAEGGTVLLDEIGEMPHRMQSGLLRVLQDRLVRPVGGSKEEKVSACVIAATNRNLERMVTQGTFREDLYYRLHVVDIQLPPLRERVEDIPILIDHFLGIFAERHQRARKSVSRAALHFLCSHTWPGNVRQLENTLLNAWVMCDRPQLEIDDFDPPGLELAQQSSNTSAANTYAANMSAANTSQPPTPPNKTDQSRNSAPPTSLSQHEATERKSIVAALAATNWNRAKAAEVCKLPRRTFYRRLKKYGIL
ncbi:MAG: sigma 54-interacting transcriptional regulator, partial [Polyangiaceae bacterium]|nr:sigma 54-interacting transcriptional regulator [Polyangiaceae bacterium]